MSALTAVDEADASVVAVAVSVAATVAVGAGAVAIAAAVSVSVAVLGTGATAPDAAAPVAWALAWAKAVFVIIADAVAVFVDEGCAIAAQATFRAELSFDCGAHARHAVAQRSGAIGGVGVGVDACVAGAIFGAEGFRERLRWVHGEHCDSCSKNQGCEKRCRRISRIGFGILGSCVCHGVLLSLRTFNKETIQAKESLHHYFKLF